MESLSKSRIYWNSGFTFSVSLLHSGLDSLIRNWSVINIVTIQTSSLYENLDFSAMIFYFRTILWVFRPQCCTYYGEHGVDKVLCELRFVLLWGWGRERRTVYLREDRACVGIGIHCFLRSIKRRVIADRRQVLKRWGVGLTCHTHFRCYSGLSQSRAVCALRINIEHAHLCCTILTFLKLRSYIRYIAMFVGSTAR